MKHEPVPMTLNPDGSFDINVPAVIDCVVEANVLFRELMDWGRLPAYLHNQCARFVRATDTIIDDHWLH